ILESKQPPYNDYNLPVFEEGSQEEFEMKNLTWRFGSALVIYHRGVGNLEHPFVQLLIEFFKDLNNMIYGIEGMDIRLISEKIPYWKEKIDQFRDSIENEGRRLYIIMMEADRTLAELKNIFKPEQAEFTVNDYITLKLEQGRTYLYVNDVLFQQCKFLLLTFPLDEVDDYGEMDSIDEIADTLKWSLEGQLDDEGELVSYDIPAHTEFWGHCSNLQAWAEYNYDTRLLHSSLSFPLLKNLYDAGDPQAKEVFQEEICKRFETYYQNTILYLLEQNYIQYLTEDQKEMLLKNWIEKDFENAFVLLIGNKHLDKFGEQYRSLILENLSKNIELRESILVEKQLAALLEELGFQNNTEFINQLVSKDRSLLKEIFDMRQYPVPTEAVTGISYTHLEVLKELQKMLIELGKKDTLLKEVITHHVQQLFETPSVANMFSLLCYSFYELVPLKKFKEMMWEKDSPFLSNIFNYLGHELLMGYFDASLVPYDLLFTYWDDECRGYFSNAVKELPSKFKKRVISGISKRKEHKTYKDAVEKLLYEINRPSGGHPGQLDLIP
ncbi:MAG: hypothetical protein ACFFDC_12010, partial [Promethearchaeota archaeon]